MYAIIETCGRQYNVRVGDQVFLEKLDKEPGESVVFDRVLAIVEGDTSVFGTPTVEGALVMGTVIKNGKGKKYNILKYKAKKGYSRRQGHRQPYTKVEIGEIIA